MVVFYTNVCLVLVVLNMALYFNMLLVTLFHMHFMFVALVP